MHRIDRSAASPEGESRPRNAALGDRGRRAPGSELDWRGWLSAAGFELCEARPLPGDVSPRRYQRLISTSGAAVILAIYPAAVKEVCARFARTAEILAAAGVPAPRVLATDPECGWMLLEDLGERTLGELGDRPWSELTPFFDEAAAIAARIADLPPELVRDLNPPLDRPLMLRELAQTRQLLLVPRGMASAGLDAAMDELCHQLGADPAVPCHRDFMARNLMPRGPGQLAVLDHQDLRLGPPAYDLASLLNDTLFPPPELEARLVAATFPGTEGRARYHRASAQRTLKAAGSYAAFAHRGSDRHLPLIGPTLHRFLRHFGLTPEGATLAPELARSWEVKLR
jgi:N-acetylmuramate 1-kinase